MTAPKLPARVLFSQHYPDGGSVASLLELVRGLRARGVEVVVASPRAWPTMQRFVEAGAEVVSFAPVLEAPAPSAAPVERRADGAPAKRSSRLRRELRRLVRQDLPQSRWLAEVIERERIDLVHANSDVASDRDVVAAALRRRVPVVVHLRGMNEYGPGVDRWVDRRLARRADAMVAISRAVADHTAAALRVDRSSIAVVDNPFALEVDRRARRPDLAEDLGVSGRRIVLLVARITAWKGHRVLLDALAQLGPGYDDVTALLVGDTSSTYGEFVLQDLHEQVRALGIGERVVFTGPRTDVADLLALADVAVHCSTEPEPFGRVVVEAMAAARPVVASAAGGVVEIVEDERTGLLVPPSDPAALAAAIRRVLDDPEAAAEMGERARDAALARFDVEGHVDAIVARYAEVLARRGR